MESRSSQTHFPGSAGKGTTRGCSRLPDPRPPAPLERRLELRPPREGEGPAAAPRARPARGSGSRSGARAGGPGCPAFPEAGEVGGRRAPSLASWEAAVRPGGGGPEVGACGRVEGRQDPGAACSWGAPAAPGGRAPWAQTKPGADAPRRLGPPRAWALGREEEAPGQRLGHGERLGRPPKGRPGGLLGLCPGQCGEQLSPKSQLGAHGLRWARREPGSERGRECRMLNLGEGLREATAQGWGLGLW